MIGLTPVFCTGCCARLRLPEMPEERREPAALDYVTPGRRQRRWSRGVIVALIGAAVALGGTIVLFCAHAMTDSNYLVAEHRRQHELLVALFGITLVLAGTIIA